jgi:hypothetical protein
VDSNRSHQWVGSAMIDPRVCLKGNGQWCDQYERNSDFDIIPYRTDAYGTVNTNTLLIPYFEGLPSYQLLSDRYKDDLKKDNKSSGIEPIVSRGLRMRSAAINEAGMRLREFEQLAQKAKPLEKEWCGGKFQIDPEQLPKGFMDDLATAQKRFQTSLDKAKQLEDMYADGLLPK